MIAFGSAVVLATASVVEAGVEGRSVVIDSTTITATITAVGALVGIAMGNLNAWRKTGVELAKIRFDADNARRDDEDRERKNQIALENIKLEAAKIAADQHAQDQERQFRATEAEINRKKADHDLLNKYNALLLTKEADERDLSDALTIVAQNKAEILALKQRLDTHATRINAESVRINAATQATRENRAAIEAVTSDSGQFRAVDINVNVSPADVGGVDDAPKVDDPKSA